MIPFCSSIASVARFTLVAFLAVLAFAVCVPDLKADVIVRGRRAQRVRVVQRPAVVVPQAIIGSQAIVVPQAVHVPAVVAPQTLIFPQQSQRLILVP